MAAPIFTYATAVTTNIAICTLLAPLPWGVGNAGGLPPNTQLSGEVIDLASFYIIAGSSGVGTIVTFQELGLDSTLSAGVLVPQWRTLTAGQLTSTPQTITLANSTTYGGVFNGPFHGIRMLLSSATGNGVAYARLSGMIRQN
jgi:hypothetical protein